MRIIFIVLLFFTNVCLGQTRGKDTVQYYMDSQFEKCRPEEAVYYRIAYKVDSFWMLKDYYLEQKTLQSEGYFSDDSFKVEEGMHYWYFSNGQLGVKERFIHGKKYGQSKSYCDGGEMVDSSLFINGMPTKFSYSWYPNGTLKFKGTYDINGSGAGEETGYFEDGTIDSFGRYSDGYIKDSVWTYYYHGKPTCRDYYNKGIRIKRECLDENGNIMSSLCDNEEPEAFSEEIMEGILKRKVRELFREYKLTGIHLITCKVCVGENGLLTAYVTKGIQKYFDQNFEDIFNNLPKARPARYYNRPTKVCESFNQYLYGRRP